MLYLHVMSHRDDPIRRAPGVFDRDGGIIGRLADCALSLPDEDEKLVESRHARIEVDGDQYWLVGITGITFLNGQPIQNEVKRELIHDATIGIGAFKLRAEILSYKGLRAALFEGLGLPESTVASGLNGDFMRTLGGLLKLTVENTKLLVDHRRVSKQRLLINVSDDVPEFSSTTSPTELMVRLLDIQSWPTQESPIHAVSKAFDTVLDHENRLTSAFIRSIDELVNRLKKAAENARDLEQLRSELGAPQSVFERIVSPKYRDANEIVPTDEKN